MRPRIGITTDVEEARLGLRHGYVECVEAAGGVPVLLPSTAGVDSVEALLAICDGLILSGGDDPIMEAWGESTHPRATPVDQRRQSFERAVLAEAERLDLPLLGICLGMQLMGLEAGGRLDQHLPDGLPTADDHWGRRVHGVSGEIGAGEVLSHHRQALIDPGTMAVAATAPDGVIEAIVDPDRPHRVGVQWHPERTESPALGADLFSALVATARQR